jgi:hypothetical protein
MYLNLNLTRTYLLTQRAVCSNYLKQMNTNDTALFKAACFIMALSLYYPFIHTSAQKKEKNAMIIGVCGHSIIQPPYTTFTHQQEFDIIKNIGFTCYRSAEFSDIDGAKRFTTFCDVAHSSKMELLVLINPDPTTFATPAEAYAYGKRIGFNSSTTLKKHHIKYYEAGNEYDGRSRIAWPSNYDTAKLKKCIEMQRGIIEGVHKGDPKAKVVLQGTPGYMDSVWAAGVRWDITGLHAYEDPMDVAPWGNEFEYCKQHFEGKPIWMTEFGGWGDRMTPVQLANWLVTNLNKWKSVASRYKLERVFIYELFNQDGYSPNEAQQGICLSDGTHKPQADSLKLWIRQNNGSDIKSKNSTNEN